MHTTCYLVRARTPLSHMCMYTSHLYIMKFVLGNMSLRMEDAENRLITEPALIGSDRLEGQRCKYAEKSYMYKYDLGHILLYRVVKLVV